MTIALKIGDKDSQVQGFIYLDAVTQYEKDSSGKVTNFPVDSGASISDHFIANNQRFSIQGVISDVDITGMSNLVSVDDEKPLNARAAPTTTRITGADSGLKFLPSAVKEWLERGSPSVAVDAFSQANIPAVELLFEELMRGVYYNSVDNKWRNKATTVVIYEMEGKNFVNAKTDLVVTNVSFREDAESGDALYLSISLEKVKFVKLQMEEVGKQAPAKTTRKKAAATSNKGNPACPTGTTKPAEQGSTASSSTEAPKSAVELIVRAQKGPQ